MGASRPKLGSPSEGCWGQNETNPYQNKKQKRKNVIKLKIANRCKLPSIQNTLFDLKGDTPKPELKDVKQNTLKEIIPVPNPHRREKARAITADMKSFNAWRAVR